MKSMKEEFLELLSCYQGILYKVSLVYFKNSADREDNFQEIVYQLWKSYPKLIKKESVGSWIYAVAINTSISKITRDSRIEYRESPPDLPEHSTILDEMSADESVQQLLYAIGNLDPISKPVMLLYLEEKSYDEIAEITGISRSNVGVRISRAKEFIKQHVKNHDHGKQ